MPLDSQLAAMLDFIAASGHPPMHESTPEVARKAFRALSVGTVRPDQVVPVGAVEDTVVAGRPARVYRPADEPAGTLLHLHGGGFVIGDLDTHDQWCRRLCSGASVVVVALDYRLAPEHPFPAGLEDAQAALEEVAADLASYGGRPLAMGGDSAGGNLTAVAVQAAPGVVDAQLLVYPATDAAGSYPSRTENGTGYFLDAPLMAWFSAQYAGDADVALDDPRVSPLHGDLGSAPPTLLVTAELDPLRDEGEAYAERLRAAGVRVESVRYDGMIHGFVDMGQFSEGAAAATADVVERFRALLA